MEKMTKPTTVRKYGKQHKKPPPTRLFAELPQTPIRKAKAPLKSRDEVAELTTELSAVKIRDEAPSTIEPPPSTPRRSTRASTVRAKPEEPITLPETPQPEATAEKTDGAPVDNNEPRPEPEREEEEEGEELRVLSWAELCPPGDRIVKIAEASYAEVYRVTNERGTSIIKVIRLESPIKAQTRAQRASGLVDEEPRPESDLEGELRISEWLADIPGFVVYKERYLVVGRACREVLETHQAFQRRAKRRDPGRLQFYPSPSRYLDATRFLVVELGDAGTALEDFALRSADQLWDIFFHAAIALARAEAHVEFEHRDLHEGNLCIRQTGTAAAQEDKGRSSSRRFGFSGLEITILDYGLSRASAEVGEPGEPPVTVAFDMERDLGLFTSEHAPQCQVYRQMRSFLLRGDRGCLPPERHRESYERTVATGEPVSWAAHEPYTNVLWLAYIYRYAVARFGGSPREAAAFEADTEELWRHLDPEAGADVSSFESASEIVCFAVESGWIAEEQLMGECPRDGAADRSILSILSRNDDDNDEGDSVADVSLRRSPRRRRQPPRPAA